MSADAGALSENFDTRSSRSTNWPGWGLIGIAAVCGAAAFAPDLFGIDAMAEGLFGSTTQQTMLGLGALSLGAYAISEHVHDHSDKSDSAFFNWDALGVGFIGGAIIASVIAVSMSIGVDMVFGFPAAHYSLIGQDVTAWSSSWLLPILDGFAIDYLGYEDPLAAAGVEEVVTDSGESVLIPD